MQLHVNVNNVTLRVLTGIFVLISLLGVGQDFLNASIRQSAFYWTESTLFKVIWLLFIPLLWLVPMVYPNAKDPILSPGRIMLALLFPTLAGIVHVGLASILIFLLSALLFDHTFLPDGVLQYFFAEDFYVIWSVYFLTSVVLLIRNTQPDHLNPNDTEPPEYIRISRSQKIIPVRIDDIFFVETDRPYVAIVTREHRYLHNTTLTGLLNQLNGNNFVRIHRSRIVNLQHIDHLHSRANGDYDLYMSNGAIIRMSRNYSQDLKDRFFTLPSA